MRVQDPETSQVRRRTIRERGIRLRNGRFLPRGLPGDLTPGQRIPGTPWRYSDHSNNMTLWYHDSFPSTNGFNVHVTVVYNDQRGQVRNGRIDVHSTLWQGFGNNKIHYGWCADSRGREVWKDLDASVPINKPIIALLHQFHFDKRALYSRKTYKRMRLPNTAPGPLNL